jgi:hypothetical protein
LIEILKLNQSDRNDLFISASNILNINKVIIEKDFWVTFLLQLLFEDFNNLHPFMFISQPELDSLNPEILNFTYPA